MVILKRRKGKAEKITMMVFRFKGQAFARMAVNGVVMVGKQMYKFFGSHPEEKGDRQPSGKNDMGYLSEQHGTTARRTAKLGLFPTFSR